MNHPGALPWLPAYADGEIGPVRSLLLRRHIARCPSCLAELEALQSTRDALRTNLTVHRAPPALAMRIASALPRQAPPPVARRSLPLFGFGGSALAGGLAGIALTLAVTRTTPVRTDRLAADAVASHIRSMMADHLTDVPTSDRHTVKPWLSARLDLSPVVKDLVADGYPLVGGRLDYVDGHRAAAIVYHRDKHVINLFALVSDDPGDAPPRQESRDGFNIVRWRQGGVSYVAVSDVEASQLLTFARLVASG
jgi:anti-sigma factor RsiW